MKQPNCKKTIFAVSLLAGIFVSAFVLSAKVLAVEEDPAVITAALQDLSTAVGQEVATKDQAIALCDSEKYFEICAKVGKDHNLYAAEEIRQVDTFINEVRGVVAEQLKNCQTTECLIGVANDLAKKVTAKDPKLAESFELTTKLVDKKQAVITAAKEAGVDYDACRNMDPDTADISTLRACAKLAKDSRIRDIIPEQDRVQREKYGDYVDKSVELRASLQSGEFQCGNGSLDGCGNFCLNPSEAAKAQGASVIPAVCRQIAQKFFGADGVKQLENAYSQINKVKDFYKKKTENILFTTIDGRTLTRQEDIGRYMEEQGRKGNVEAVEKGMDFMVAKGFINPEEKEFALKFVQQIKNSGADINFENCAQNPEACREFIPEDHRGEFEAGIEIDQIMRQEIGFDPRECSKGEFDPTIGDKCFQGSKRALSKLEALATKSKEAAAIVAEIKGHVTRGEEFENRKGEIERTFQQEGGPGGCRSEQECRTYCSDSTHGPECIAFGSKQGISGFRGEDAVQKFQDYNNSLQRPQFGGDTHSYPGQGNFGFPGGQNQGFPGQGYPVQGGFPGQGYPVQGGFPGGQGGYPIPGGYPGGGPAGPSPECFAAIKAGDYARAKLVCESRVATPEPIRQQVCPALYSVDNCPVGEIKVVAYSSPECGVYYTCKKDYVPVPSYSYAPYPTGGNNYCPPYTYWDESVRRCRSNTEPVYSYQPYPTYSPGTSTCSPELIRLLGDGCHYMATNYYCDGPMTKSAKYGDTVATAGCSGGGGSSPYPTSSGTSSLKRCFYPNATKNGQSPGYTVWCEADYYNCHVGEPSGATVSLDGLSLGAPSTCESGWTQPTYTYAPPPSSCSSSLTNLLGTGCHWMSSDSSGRGVYCNSEMTKSAKEGDTITTAGCTGGYQSYSPYPTSSPGGKPQCSDGIDNDNDGKTDYPADSSCYGPDDWDEYYPTTGGTYSPYPTGSTSSCSQSLVSLLGTGCHFMYNDSSGKAIYCNSEMNKSAHEGDTATIAGCTGGTSTYSPYPSYSYTPYPSGSPTSGGSCPSGSHTMYVNNAGGYCMSDADGNKCGPLNSSSTSGFGSCSTYQTSTTYSPAPSCPSGQWWDYSRNVCVSSTTTSYSPYPTASSSCPSGSHSMGSYCMSDSDSSKCGPSGSTSTSGFGSCSTYSTTYSPYPTYSSTYSAPPPPTSAPCPSGQWWDFATSSCHSSTYSSGTPPPPTPTPTYTYVPPPTASYTPVPTYETTYTPYPSPTYTYTPAPTYESTPYPTYSTTACPSGQVWDEATHVCRTAFNFQRHQMAMAHTIMACGDSGGRWNSEKGSCQSSSFAKVFFGNIGKIFSRFLK